MTMEALPTEMTKLDLVSKCLDFNQALADLGQTISLSINIGSFFTFNLDTRVKATTLDTVKPKASLDTRRYNTLPPWTRLGFFAHRPQDACVKIVWPRRSQSFNTVKCQLF